MDKQTALTQIRTWVTTGVVTRAEIQDVIEQYDSHVTTAVPTGREGKSDWSAHFTVKNALYLLGALVLGLGIVTFVAQVWDLIGSIGRVVVTLGSGVFLFGLGIAYAHHTARQLAAVFHALGAILMGGGGLVLLAEWNILDLMSTTIWYAILTSTFAGVSLLQRSTVVAFFAIASAVATAYLLSFTLGDSFNWSWQQTTRWLEWLTILLGLSLVAGMFFIERTFASGLTSLMGFFGINMVLLTIAIKMSSSGWWEIGFFFVAMGCIALAVYLARTWLLVLSMLYLFFYVIYITSVYFADSIGWPLALMLLGGILLALGYGSLQLHQRFIKPSAD